MSSVNGNNGFLKSVILSIIGMIVGSASSVIIIAYNYGGYIKEIDNISKRITAVENTVSSGKDARIALTEQVRYLNEKFNELKIQNNEDHKTIINGLNKLFEEKRVSMDIK